MIPKARGLTDWSTDYVLDKTRCATVLHKLLNMFENFLLEFENVIYLTSLRISMLASTQL